MSDERTTVFEAQNVSMFTRGGFCMSKRDVRSIKVETGKYAQYDKAYFVTFMEKGKRKARGVVLSYAPYLLVTRQGVALTPDDPFEAVESSTPGIVASRTRFSSCDPAIQTEFETKAKTFEAMNPGAVLFKVSEAA